MSSCDVPVLIQQMLQPAFYSHPVMEPIRLIQTHASFVLLTGDYVYKVKKPVNYGFLDYSTLARRQLFCEREVRFNQRGAPDVYLEVLPIVYTGSQFQMGGAGEPVEYAVKMRQFPQEGLFINLFEAGLLGETHLEELGRVVAKFHAESHSDDWIRSFGKVSKIQPAINANYEQTKKYIGGPQTPEQFDETQTFTEKFFSDREALFNARIESNKIRECHGDLHLKNIALWKNRILLFDCIEFNENFRFVDVMFDVAYAVMDLEARQRPDLGNAYLNSYVEQTGDWEGLQVLPLYLIRQSYVRAKVTSFLLDDLAVLAEEKKKATEISRQYYRLAWQYTQPRRGQVILMSGLSGSGKSTVARQLARRISAIHIRSDAVRKHLGGVALNERGDANLYTAEMTQKTYHRLLELGIMLAKQGWPVILDAKYDRQAPRLEAVAQSQANHLPLQIIHCTAPVDVLRDRLQRRQGDIADATADLLPVQQAATEPFTAEQAYVKTIDTTQKLDTQLEHAINYDKQ